MTPEHHLWVNLHLQSEANTNRTYSELKDGDMFRYKLKPNICRKGHGPKWRSTRRKIAGNSTDNQYVS